MSATPGLNPLFIRSSIPFPEPELFGPGLDASQSLIHQVIYSVMGSQKGYFMRIKKESQSLIHQVIYSVGRGA